MPLATIWRDPKIITDQQVIQLRTPLTVAMTINLKIDNHNQIEIRVRDIGPLDTNYAPIGIEIDTGAGKENWRIEKRFEIAKAIAGVLHNVTAESDIYPKDLFGPTKSYVWLRICDSAFVPIGSPDQAR